MIFNYNICYMIFDIGSNIGNWALANVSNCDKIISIEASPITFKKLLNNCKNDKIVLLNYAVCNNNGNDIIFYQANNDVLSTINKNWLTDINSRFYNHPYVSIVCKTITIDNLIKEYGVPDLIKIDVEGAEMQVLEGIDFDNHFIGVISLEDNGYTDQTKQFLLNKNYKFVTKICADRIFKK